MSDVTLDNHAGRASYGRLIRMLALLLLAAGLAVVANSLANIDMCNSRLGTIVVALKLDSAYSGCRCVRASLDFRDACNSAYIGAI